MESTDFDIDEGSSLGGGMLNANWSADVPTLLLALPVRLWRLYVDHLWHVQPGSWVARSTSTFQFLAYLIILPFLLLTLLVSFHVPLVLDRLGIEGRRRSWFA